MASAGQPEQNRGLCIGIAIPAAFLNPESLDFRRPNPGILGLKNCLLNNNKKKMATVSATTVIIYSINQLRIDSGWKSMKSEQFHRQESTCSGHGIAIKIAFSVCCFFCLWEIQTNAMRCTYNFITAQGFISFINAYKYSVINVSTRTPRKQWEK